MDTDRAEVPCPLCGAEEYQHWGSENGYDMVRCRACRFLYCNPQPTEEARRREVELGQHAGDNTIDVNFRRNPFKIRSYGRLLGSDEFFGPLFASGAPVRWLDVGCGYGELIEAVGKIAPAGSTIVGVEPNAAKATSAREAGLDVRNTFDLDEVGDGWDVISLINVFSHLTDPAGFIAELTERLAPGGRLFMETGNAAEIEAEEYPDPLYLPDHLCFAGEEHLRRLLTEQGYEVEAVRRDRRDGAVWAGWAAVRKLRGRESELFVPYRSPFRTMFISGRLAPSESPTA